MEFLFEFILELVLDLFIEGSIEVSSNHKFSKWIRYPLLILLLLFFAAVIFLLFFCGVCLIPKNLAAGIVMFALGLFFLIGGIVKFIKMYRRKMR